VDFLQLVSGISDEAHINIPERDYPYLATLNSTYAYIRSRLASGPRTPPSRDFRPLSAPTAQG
jgi:hypothetical protein